ncbi:hypothetical protein BJY04DRAFT_214422 [Aspergillus karnatakaensis]|uniref:uncharacterized protein n=1 Tax=Aspergillus karnatakaensis TaxID=1810916 RepID=UPI003CCD21B1
MSLIPIICTYQVPPATLSSILSIAYSSSQKLDSPPSLILLWNNNPSELQEITYDSMTQPPIDTALENQFVGWSVDKVAEFLHSNLVGTDRNTVLDYSVFLVADERTSVDGDTLLLVHVQHIDGAREREVESVRVSAEYVNSKAVGVSVAAEDVAGLRSLVDEDGVFRGGRDRAERALPKKGGSAPRKQL